MRRFSHSVFSTLFSFGCFFSVFFKCTKHLRKSIKNALLAICIPGCVSFSFKDSDVKSKDTVYNPPTALWSAIDAGTSDVGYRHSADNSTLSLNSVCDQYQSLSLEDLSKTLTAGFDEEKEISSEPATVGGFPALSKVVTAKLDGQPFKMAFVVLRSKRCVYDISMIARPENFDARVNDFKLFINSFQEGTAP